MSKKTRVPLKVVKVPLDRTVRTDFRKEFRKLPRLYLELIENQLKIDAKYQGKEFQPDYSNLDMIKPPQTFSENKNDVNHSLEDIFNDDSDDDVLSVKSVESEDPLTKQLKNLLSTDGDDVSTNASDSPNRFTSGRSKKRTPPTLDQLKQAGAYQAPKRVGELDSRYEDEEDVEDKKRELLFKFDILKKSYKGEKVPEFSIHSDYRTMERSYEHTVKKLSLDSTVENYKTYLIGGFMVVEYVFGSWFKFDMQGFTQQQILSMNSYEKLLIELGEKSYVPEGSNWPVELRLLFLIIINAAFFIISKMILRKTGSNLINMVNNMNATSIPTNTGAAKRKMKGPSINLDEIPEFE